MRDILLSWLRPEGFVAVGIILTAIQNAINRRNIKKIELATNSMKDALVEATGRASHAEGKAEGMAEAEARGST
jgi:putative effector of murein hydrolase